MRSEHVLRYFVIPAFAIAMGATVSSSCIGVNYPVVAFRCNPRQSDNCPETHTCCSDDPSTADGELPTYAGKTNAGSTPLYADLANNAGTSGMCVNTKKIGAGLSLTAAPAAGCPIPCNPKWSASDVDTICGADFTQGGTQSVCCQTVELGPEDCVQTDNGTGSFRPVTGADIGNEGGADKVVPRTNWAAADHDTHQDPGGKVCIALAGGDTGSAKFAECIRHLTVADQRGFCMQIAAGTGCPTAAPTYIDACEAKNGQGAPMGG